MGRDKETRRQGDKGNRYAPVSPCLLVSPSPCQNALGQMFMKTVWLSAGLIATVALAGCGKVEPPPFRLNMTYVVAKQISTENQQAIADLLGAMFGTPDHPYAMTETGLSQSKLDMAAGPVWSDESGGKHGLYRRHCAHCHGISGDGHGPTALILNPYPRAAITIHTTAGAVIRIQPTTRSRRRTSRGVVSASADHIVYSGSHR